MAATYNLVPRQASTDAQDTQHLYFIAAAAIVFSLVILRIVLLRRRNQSLSNFFRLGPSSQYAYGSYPPHNSNHGSMYHGIQLASPPAAYHPDRRIRAADTDTHGRRLGTSGTESGKDALPPYDNFDRPPKYIEAYGGPPPPMEQSAVTSSPSGGEGGTAHPDITSRVTEGNAGQRLDDTHDVAGVTHESEPAPPAHHDLTSS